VLNLVIASGEVKSPALRYDAHSKPEFRFTFQQMEKDWPLYLPCFSPGAAGERLAGEVEAGQHILITSGKLAYKKRTTKAGEVSRLEILVWQVDRLSESTGPAQADAPECGMASMRPRAPWSLLACLSRRKPGSLAFRAIQGP
jgi:hypothetical protein